MGRKGVFRIYAGGDEIVLLIPARTDTQYFHDYIYGKAEIRFVRGRLRFTDDDGVTADPAPFPSMVVVYNSKSKEQSVENFGGMRRIAGRNERIAAIRP